MYSVSGDLITTFENQPIYSQEPLSFEDSSYEPDPIHQQMKTYQLNLSDSRGKILAVVKEKWLAKQDKIELDKHDTNDKNEKDQKSPNNTKKKQNETKNKRKSKQIMKSKKFSEDPE